MNFISIIHSYKIQFTRYKFIAFFLFFIYITGSAQTEKENQFTNEYQFNRVIGKKTELEFDFGHNYTSGINETNPFYKSSQLSTQIWLHYFASKKWKFSGLFGYFYNRDVPELSQKSTAEIRFAFQGIYYIIRKEHVLTNRFRIEDRILENDTKELDVVFRFREMIKLVYPLTSIKLGEGSLYSICSEEVVFKTKGTITGPDRFDRNIVTAGLGYSFTDTFKFELTYINEYLPRNSNDKVFHTISTTLIFNDLITTLKKRNGSIPSY